LLAKRIERELDWSLFTAVHCRLSRAFFLARCSSDKA
jgi:hypothetical protein